MPSAARELCTDESNPDTAVFRVTGQRALIAPVSKFREKIWCPTPLTSASRKRVCEARSATGVAVMPTGLMLPHGRPDVIGAPTFRCQITAPVVALSAYTLFDSVTAITIDPFGLEVASM